MLRPDLDDLDETKSFVYGEYKEHPLCKNRNPHWKLFAFKQIADAGTHPDEVPLGLQGAPNIFLTAHVQSAWHELDEEMGWMSEVYGYKPAKMKN